MNRRFYELELSQETICPMAQLDRWRLESNLASCRQHRKIQILDEPCG